MRYDEIFAAMLKRAKELLADGTVNRVIGWKRGEFSYDVTPAVFGAPEDMDAGFVYDAITRLIVTEDMARRKAKMIELGDAFIAFPGGTGTLEEIAEVMSKVSLGHWTSPAYCTISTGIITA